MIIKGLADIRGVRNLNSGRGPATESKGLLKLYQLAAEKENLLKKRAWVRRQKEQTDKRLAEIAYAMHSVKQTVEELARRESLSDSRSQSFDMFIKY